jgi:hypothetical protein
MEEDGFGYEKLSSTGFFTADLTALFVTLQPIGKVIRPPENA